MKIADLKKNIKKLIYKQILEVNEIDENCMLLCEVILKDEAQYVSESCLDDTINEDQS